MAGIIYNVYVSRSLDIVINKSKFIGEGIL